MGCVLWIDRKEVPPREQSTKMEIMGLFAGARVVRGMDWSWADQDGNVTIAADHIRKGWDQQMVFSERERSLFAVAHPSAICLS